MEIEPIFVFGSNLAGRHGKGAALEAMQKHGAIYGTGVGPQGNSYAIPTKDNNLRTLPLDQIKAYIDQFIAYANTQRHRTFFLTRVGCGLAGYKDSDIGPLFKGVSHNVQVPEEWRQYV